VPRWRVPKGAVRASSTSRREVTAFRSLGEEVRYRGPFLTVVGGTYETPEGEPFEREFIRHPGAVAIVPFVDAETVLLVRQFRAAVGMDLLEIPAGLLDVDGEAPELTARRELEEEAGRRVIGSLELLVEYVPAAGMADHRVQIYACRESEPCDARPHGPEEGHMTVEAVRLADAPKLIADARIVDGKTIVGLLLAARPR
jgi:8-oxo-dGTP pyrophosphatase MutT (NUDIX family)